MSKKNKNGNYEVGYKKPPKHSQFKKGQSGNKRGRRKKRVTLTDVEEAFDKALSAYITVNENGVVHQVTRVRALAMQVVNKALKGNHQAMNAVLSLLEKQAASASEDLSSGATADEFKAEMEAIFEEMASKAATKAKASTENDGHEHKDGENGGGAGRSEGMPTGKPH